MAALECCVLDLNNKQSLKHWQPNKPLKCHFKNFEKLSEKHRFSFTRS